MKRILLLSVLLTVITMMLISCEKDTIVKQHEWSELAIKVKEGNMCVTGGIQVYVELLNEAEVFYIYGDNQHKAGVYTDSIKDCVFKMQPANDLDNITLAFEGNLCTHDGIPVSVIIDTLYARYNSIGGYRTDTVWYTEYYYYVVDGSTIWCNEKYLKECE